MVPFSNFVPVMAVVLQGRCSFIKTAEAEYVNEANDGHPLLLCGLLVFDLSCYEAKAILFCWRGQEFLWFF